MDNTNTNFRQILVRKPFYELTPKNYMTHGIMREQEWSENVNCYMPDDTLYRRIKTQHDFLREFYPSSHKIWDKNLYPDIYRKNPEDGKWYIQEIQRTAFAFQRLIHTKHTLHLTGNDIQFELASADDKKNEQLQKLLNTFKKEWYMKDMEVRHFEAVSAYMKVAEVAVVGFFDSNGVFGTKTLSFDNGDILYPHIDSLTGEMTVFARKYIDYDEQGIEKTEWVEVWDNKMFYRFKKQLNEGAVKETIKRIANIFGIDNYSCVEEKPHGFPFLPVAYARNEDGPCWAPVQRNIEDYEEAYSYLCENNKAYAFPMLKLKGDGDDIMVVGDTNGGAKTIQITDTDGDAEFIDGTDASNAFATQLNKSYDLIYELSFTVKPPELKSGDLPGVAIKLLFSPAIEIAENDAKMLHPFLMQLVKMCKYGIGMEQNCMASMTALPIHAWVEVYVHQNKSEMITNIATAVQNGFLSKQTASERCPDLPVTNEIERIIREKKEEQQQDLLMDMQRADNETQNAIEEQEAQAQINAQQSGQDVNTGGGRKAGRPNESGRQYDSNGNWPGRNNWNKYDNK
nr:MAG TPA: portal protein [Caudoviricetes sp.]